MKNIDGSLISRKYNQIIKTIIDESVKQYPALKHIILYGGYGRDEGAWYQDDSGNVYPYNDFDLVFVFCGVVPDMGELLDFRKKLALLAEVQWIDITLDSESNLPNKKNSIFNYDLKFGSRVIYGDEKILDVLPEFSAEKINLIEGEILFFTRLWTFSGGLTSSINLTKDDFRFFRYQMSKAILAVMDAVLLINQSYHTSYKMRCEILLKKKFELVRDSDYVLFKWALDQKLSPTNEFMSNVDIEELYMAVANMYRYYMLGLLSKKYNTRFNSILEFSRFYKKNVMVNLKRIAYPLLKRSFTIEKVYYANIVQMNVLSMILMEGDTDKLLRSSSKIMNKFGYNITNNLESIKAAVADLRQNI